MSGVRRALMFGGLDRGGRGLRYGAHREPERLPAEESPEEVDVKALTEMIRKHERLVPHPYDDERGAKEFGTGSTLTTSAESKNKRSGRITIGYGTNVSDGVTREEAEVLARRTFPQGIPVGVVFSARPYDSGPSVTPNTVPREILPGHRMAGDVMIGFARNLNKEPLLKEEAEWLLERRLGSTLGQLDAQSWWYRLNAARKAAVADFVYNVGWGGFGKFKGMQEALAKGDFEAAAREMRYRKDGKTETPWWTQTKGRAQVLYNIIQTGRLPAAPKPVEISPPR